MTKKKEPDWIGIGEAVHLIADALGGAEAAQAVIAGKLKQGRLRCSAAGMIQTFTLRQHPGIGKISGDPEQVIQSAQPGGSINVGVAMWSAPEGVTPTTEWNWDVGSFSTSYVSDYGQQESSVSGLKVIRSEIESLAPIGSGAGRDGRVNSGVTRSDDWIPWTAELVAYYHEEGFSSAAKQAKIMNDLYLRLQARGEKPIGGETVRRTIKAVLERLEEFAHDR